MATNSKSTKIAGMGNSACMDKSKNDAKMQKMEKKTGKMPKGK